MEKQVTEYLTLEFFKKTLDIQDDKLDGKLQHIILETHVEMDMRLKTYPVKVTIEAESHSRFLAGIVASRLARSLWYESIDQLKMARYSRAIYGRQIQMLIKIALKEKRDKRNPH